MSRRTIQFIIIITIISGFNLLEKHSLHENWVGRSGYWEFTDEVIRGQGFMGFNKSYYSEEIFTDFIYEVKINKLSEDGNFGLLFRYDEKSDDGYSIQFWPHGGCIFVIADGAIEKKKIKINQPLNQLIGTNIWNTVKIIGIGSRFEIYLNNHLFDIILDYTFTKGRLGLVIKDDPRQIATFKVLKMEAL